MSSILLAKRAVQRAAALKAAMGWIRHAKKRAVFYFIFPSLNDSLLGKKGMQQDVVGGSSAASASGKRSKWTLLLYFILSF